MTTKLITSLDELKPGMKTKDGWEYRSRTNFLGIEDITVAWYGRVFRNPIVCYIDRKDLRRLFLNQEVEVPE